MAQLSGLLYSLKKYWTLLILILLGVLNILKFRIKSRKYWYSAQRSFENFVLFYLPFSAQFFVDAKRKLNSFFIEKENITEPGRPWLQSIRSKMTGRQFCSVLSSIFGTILCWCKKKIKVFLLKRKILLRRGAPGCSRSGAKWPVAKVHRNF